ncbi:DUF6783 domain-containing protein [Robinsoniella peoriensis]
MFENSFRHLHTPLCVIFAPNSGYIVRLSPFIRYKSPTNWDAQLPESNFKTRFNIQGSNYKIDKQVNL